MIEKNSIEVHICYIKTLQKRIYEKDRIIQEADNCIFNSLFYDSVHKTDSENVILDKVRWRYKYANTNKEKLCEMFKYDPCRDTLSWTIHTLCK